MYQIGWGDGDWTECHRDRSRVFAKCIYGSSSVIGCLHKPDEERAQLHSAKDDSGFSYHVLSPEEAKEKAERRKHGGDKLNELKDGAVGRGD